MSTERAPQRIQLSRAKGWRKPEGAVVVARPTKWGNPYTVGVLLSASSAVKGYRLAVRAGYDGVPGPTEIRAELAGRDLACWCPLDQPCHADVLLEIANSGDVQ